MKPNFRLLLFLMLLCWSPVYPQDYFQTHSLRPDKVQLVILNPTVGNLENFMRLLQFHAFSIPNLELIGVYYPDQNYDFRKSIEFLKNRPDLPIALHQIKGKLHPDSLFTSNRCSREFYQIFKNSRGVLALGGPDIPPTVYHAQTHLTTEIIDPWRHYFECSFLFHLLGGKQNSDFQPFLKENPNYVILGFCLGMQTLNVATGGTLIQDIPSQVYQIFTIDSVFRLPDHQIHKNYWFNLPVNTDSVMSYHLHPIDWLSQPDWLKDSSWPTPIHPLVCSAHHQCVGEIGQGFKIVATSLDRKIPEMMIHQTYPNVMGVQFHPENSDIYDPDFLFRQKPGDSLILILPLLKANGATHFYEKLWKYYLSFN